MILKKNELGHGHLSHGVMVISILTIPMCQKSWSCLHEIVIVS